MSHGTRFAAASGQRWRFVVVFGQATRRWPPLVAGSANGFSESFSSPSTLRLPFASRVNGRLLSHCLRDISLSLSLWTSSFDVPHFAARVDKGGTPGGGGGGRLFDACRTRSEPKAARHDSKQQRLVLCDTCADDAGAFDGFATQVPLSRRKLARGSYRGRASYRRLESGRPCCPIAAGVVSLFCAFTADGSAEALPTRLLGQ